MTDAFNTSTQPLGHLLSCIEAGKLALPHFQRDYVWAPAQVAELLCSLEREFPAGSILTIKSGQTGLFAERAFEGAPKLAGKADELVLDGQQRLTSLYGAFYGTHPTHRFYVRVRDLLEGRSFEDALFSIRAAQPITPESETDNLWFPLARLLVGQGFLGWALGKKAPELLEGLAAITTVFDRLKGYRFPVVTLREGTTPEAVCRIFTAINSTGARLTVFDLLAARLWTAKVSLRDLLNEAFEQDEVLKQYLSDNPVRILQCVALLAGRSVTQGALLDLSADEVTKHWQRAVTGLRDAIILLRDECGVLRPKYLPYAPALVALGAAAAHIRNRTGPDQGAAREMLKRWFWCTSFGERYDSSADSRLATDYEQLSNWLNGGPVPVVVATFDFLPSDLQTTTRDSSGLYRAVLSLMLEQGALDFHKRSKLTAESIRILGVDDHHVFPKKSEIGKAAPPHLINSILNRVLIDPATNKRISNRRPSDYLGEIAAAWDSTGALEQVLASHLLPADAEGPLRTDDLEKFLDWRQNRIANEVEARTGWARRRSQVARDRLSELAAALKTAAIPLKTDVSSTGGYEGFSMKLRGGAYLWLGTWTRARELSADDWLWLQWKPTTAPSAAAESAWVALRDIVSGGAEFPIEGTRVAPVRTAEPPSFLSAVQRLIAASKET